MSEKEKPQSLFLSGGGLSGNAVPGYWQNDLGQSFVSTSYATCGSENFEESVSSDASWSTISKDNVDVEALTQTLRNTSMEERSDLPTDPFPNASHSGNAQYTVDEDPPLSPVYVFIDNQHHTGIEDRHNGSMKTRTGLNAT
jgi:hypothetical protein